MADGKALRHAVVRQVNAAVNRGLNEVNARSCFVLVCRDEAEVNRAMDLFRRWKAGASNGAVN